MTAAPVTHPSVSDRPEAGAPRPRSLRVLHVISGLFYGGGQRVVVDLLRELPSAARAECRLCLLGSGGTLLDDLADVTLAYDGQYNTLKTLWRGARALRRVVREQQVDVLHTHGVDADLIGALAVCGTGVIQLCHLHITPPAGGAGSWKSRLRRRLLRRLTSRARTRFIAVSDAVREQMAAYYGIPLERITTVRNGVRVAEFSVEAAPPRAASGELIIGAAGRLEPMKGFEFLIDAAARLRQQGVPFQLKIAGSGQRRDALQALARSHGIEQQVEFLGQVTDMPAFYRRLSVFVLPSVSTEGLPLVVLEAMAMGLPVVATRLAGAPEVIEDGRTGVLLPPGDSASLAAALARLAADRAQLSRLAAAGAAHVRSHFTVERAAAEVALVYEQVSSLCRRSAETVK